MSSVGQVAGGIIGGAIGFMAGGNVMLGVSIGASIGGYIDPPKGQNTVGPRLEDLTVQTSTYGAVIPRLKGTIAVTGNVFWLEGDKLKEITNTKKVGGKGGPTAKQTTYSYTATFAVGLSHQISAPIAGLRRLWLGNTLVYDAGSDNLQSIIASNFQAGVVFKVYDGRDDQSPDPRMQADKGVANVSGYPGRCYIVFYDLDLTEKYNNTLLATQVKAELVCGTASPEYDVLQTMAGDYYYTAGREIYCASFGLAKATYGVIKYDPWGGNPLAVEFWETEYGVKETMIGGYSLASIGFLYAPHRLFVSDADRPVLMNLEGYDDGYGHTNVKLFWHELGDSTAVTDLIPYTELSYLNYTAAVDGGDTYLTYRGGSNVIKFSGTAIALRSAASYRIKHAGLSESYLFGIYDSGYPASSTTVYKFDRATLALLDTYVQPVTATWAAIKVIDDDTFYTLSDDDVYKWEGGVVVSTVVSLLPYTGQDGTSVWFNVLSDSPVYAFLLTTIGTRTRTAYVAHEVISTQAAKLRDIVTEECALAGISSGDLDLTELVNSDVRGYRVSQAGSVRSVLEQLQAAFPFDVIQSGYKLKFKSRGGSAVLTVPESDLGAHTGNDTPSRFMLTTEMPSQVPAKVTFNFLNADREYDPDEQSAAFTAQDVKNSYTVSLPLVMTPTEALQAADVLLKKEQRERATAGTFWLPPADDYRKLEAADVIDVIAQGRTHTLRLTKVTQLPDGRIECDGKLAASAAYASTAQAQPSLALGQTLVPLAGSSELLLLDIPRIVSDQDVPGISLGMYGFTDGWSGGVALRSDDSGESYNSIVGFSSKTEVFTVSGTPAAVPPYSIDSVTALIVTPAWTGADLFSITDAQLYTLGNLAAYGSDGRWEIVCFKTVVDNGDGTYTLRDFLRGRFGSEWAMSLHVAGDKLVMLDPDRVDFAGLPSSAINSLRVWRGVTTGAALDSAIDISDIYEAHNLKPLAPVDMKGSRDVSSLDWTFAMTRRSRWPVEAFSGAVTPIGESAESYALDIFDAGFSTIKRTLTSATPSFAYSSADQIADFGINPATVYVDWYQISSVVGRGYPSRASLTMNLNAASDYIVFGSHFDGTNGSTTISEVTGKAVTCFGNAQLSTSGFKYGTACMALDGNGDYVSTPHHASLDLVTGDWTIRGYIWVTALSGGVMEIVNKDGVSGSSYSQYSVAVNSSGKLFCFLGNGNGTSPTGTTFTGTTTISTGAWHYFEVSCAAGTVRGFLNGNLEFSGAKPAMYAGSKALLIGYQTGQPASAYFNGNIDDLSILSGYAEHTSAYTPPAAPF